jgi:hypothetical protein
MRVNRAEQESVSGLGWKGISRTAFPSGILESDTLFGFGFILRWKSKMDYRYTLRITK